ncbi:MAG TPA: hypothetical protein VLA99_09120 [Nitrospiraceae bacterium]|nr:hypothetical protein [Nitrospiraceae bacterium]
MSEPNGMPRQPDELLRLLQELRKELEQLLRGFPASDQNRDRAKTRPTDPKPPTGISPQDSTQDVADSKSSEL